MAGLGCRGQIGWAVRDEDGERNKRGKASVKALFWRAEWLCGCALALAGSRGQVPSPADAFLAVQRLPDGSSEEARRLEHTGGRRW